MTHLPVHARMGSRLERRDDHPGFVQRGPMDVRIIDFIGTHRTLGGTSRRSSRARSDGATTYLPHDGRTRNFQTGKSTEDLMRDGPEAHRAGKTSASRKASGRAHVVPRCYFDQDKTGRLLECLKRYRRALHQQTNEPMGPLQ